MTTIALGIPHTPWIAERQDSMRRLRASLDNAGGNPLAAEQYAEFTEREPNDRWSERMWGWQLRTGADWLLTLQDDVIVCEGFWARLRRMLADAEKLHAQIINLEAVHPAARALYEAGQSWYSCADQVVGVGYLIERTALAEFLAWRAAKLREGWRTARPGGKPAIDEDTCLGLFAMATGRKIYAPVPTLIDHDTTVESTYGNENHTGRRPKVTLVQSTMSVVGWPAGERIRHFGRVYGEGLVQLARRWIEGWTEADHVRVMQDDGAQNLRELVLREELKELQEGKRTQVYVATRTRGRVHPDYFGTIWRMIRASRVDLVHGWNVHEVHSASTDLVRSTSRMMRQFLESSSDVLFFVDDDVKADPRALLGMLASGRDIVWCPYPAREETGGYRIFVEEDVAEILANPEALMQRLKGGDGTLPAVGGLGCCVVRRHALEKLVKYYMDEPMPAELEQLAKKSGLSGYALAREAYELGRKHGHRVSFMDVVSGEAHLTCALPMLLIDNYRLLSEDLSFMARAKRAGLEPRMYLGPGSPVSHMGDKCWEGSIEHFGLQRRTD
jgi:hypothetical protein